MCGIAGIVRSSAGAGPRKNAFERLAADLRHRGPDAFGFLGWTPGSEIRAGSDATLAEGAAVGLVHTRLAILDLSAAGTQPMVSNDGQHAIVYNGEIYNYLELRQELQKLGHRFTSTSDTEVLLAALIEWDTAALTRLEGMFAFAMVDARKRSVLIARDPFGIKPLFYRTSGGEFAFASEMRALLALQPKERIQANSTAVYRYLRHGITDDDDQSLIDGVRHLVPGTFLRLSLDDVSRPEPKQYWSLRLDRPADISFEEAARAVRDAFLTNVERHLRSDVQVGACLSGGIDSSAIVSAMRTVGKPTLELHTFSYLADDPQLSEERWVRQVAQACGATLHTAHPSAEDLAADLDRLIAIQHEPFASTSIYAQHRVLDLAKRAGVKVVLNGQGADELLGGYTVFIGARIASLVRSGRIDRALRLASHARRQRGHSRAHLHAGRFLVPRTLQEPLRSLVGRDSVPAWLNTTWMSRNGVTADAMNHTAGHRDILRSELEHSVTTSLRTLLRYEDRNSMAYSLESRVPFLTTGFANLLLSLPEEYIVGDNGMTKRVFRAAMRGIVPDAVLDRRDKIGFETPEQSWLGHLRHWTDPMLSGETARSIPVFNHSAAWKDWQSGVTDPRRYRAWMWRWVNLVRWTELVGVSY